MRPERVCGLLAEMVQLNVRYRTEWSKLRVTVEPMGVTGWSIVASVPITDTQPGTPGSPYSNTGASAAYTGTNPSGAAANPWPGNTADYTR
jgi:hypothetical protein